MKLSKCGLIQTLEEHLRSMSFEWYFEFSGKFQIISLILFSIYPLYTAPYTKLYLLLFWMLLPFIVWISLYAGMWLYAYFCMVFEVGLFMLTFLCVLPSYLVVIVAQKCKDLFLHTHTGSLSRLHVLIYLHSLQ